MKTLLRTLLIICLVLIGAGFYFNMEDSGSGERYIGIGVVILAFLLMPLFIYHRYKDKDLSNYSFKNDFWNKQKKD